MIRYAARAVPWVRVGTATVLVIVLMELVGRWPWTLWPLEGAAVGLLAGATAWCFDEPAAAVVDPAPRSLAWRTTARASGVLVLVAAWATSVWRAWDSLFGHPWAVTMQGIGAVLAGAAWATWRRSGGEPSPGLVLGTSVVPFATAWALARPLDRQIPIFPYGYDGAGDWDVSQAGWTLAATGAAVLLVTTLADWRWWGTGASPDSDPESGSGLLKRRRHMPPSAGATFPRARSTQSMSPSSACTLTAPISSIAKTLCLGVLMAAIALVLTSCTSADSDAEPPTTDAQTAPSPSSFESGRHAYTIELPAGWVAAEYGGTWTTFEQFTPGAEVPGEDVVSSTASSGFLVANSMAIPAGMTRSDWLAELGRRVRSGLDQKCRLTTGADVIAGERATIIRQRCDEMTIIGRSLTHAGRGYYFTIGFPTGESSTAATLDDIVSSIRFADQ